MPESTKAEVQAPRATGKIRNPQDFYGGLVLVLVAIFALWAGSDLTGIRGFQFGPGTAPRLFIMLLGLNGLAIMAIGMVTAGTGTGAVESLARAAVRARRGAGVRRHHPAARPRDLDVQRSSWFRLPPATRRSGGTGPHRGGGIEHCFACCLFPYVLNLPMQLWPPVLILSRTGERVVMMDLLPISRSASASPPPRPISCCA